MSDATNTLPVDLYIDYVCPWCYLSLPLVERLQREQDVEVRWHPFPLHPDTPAEGLALVELFGGRDMSAVHERLERMLREASLDYAPDREKTYNSRLAQELGLWAATQANGQGLHRELYRAYFVHNRNLAEQEVLLEAVERAGLDSAAANEVLRERSFSPAVDEEWRQARSMGITGVPSFVAGGFLLSGCQPYAEMERFINYVRENVARR